jgi:hypothetical protein
MNTNLTENWKPIANFPDYSISNLGRIFAKRRYKKGKILKTPIMNSGYCTVKLYNNTQAKDFLVHRLVLTAFVGICPPGQEGCHKNSNKTDNRLENLRWGTRADNEYDKIALGKANIGERHGMSKLVNDQVIRIRELYVTGKYSHRTLAKEFNVSHQTIADICSRNNWKHLY